MALIDIDMALIDIFQNNGTYRYFVAPFYQ
jgi:hypothetical protein